MKRLAPRLLPKSKAAAAAERPEPGAEAEIKAKRADVAAPAAAAAEALASQLASCRLAVASLEDLEFASPPRVLGTGSFGRVCLARHATTGEWVAVKSLLKEHVLRKGQVAHLRSEVAVLRLLDHPGAVRLRAALQDGACVHLVMDLAAGGEFFSHLRAAGRLPEDAARFYAAEAALALEHLHARNVAYRDLKPENLLLDSDGHLKLADFGFAKVLPPGRRTYTLCGTPDYLAPEVILNKGHGRAVDWWALGVLVYEMLCGYPPFGGEDALDTYNKVLRGALSFPAHVSPHARDLIRRLLTADLSRRLGCLAAGAADVRNHAWFRAVDFAALRARKAAPPIRPRSGPAAEAVNFVEEYAGLAPLPSESALTPAEQALFAGI
jgi:protein kinase A